MGMNTFDGDVVVAGTLRCGALVLPANSITDTNFNSASPLGVTKTRHQYIARHSQVYGSVVVAKQEAIHVAMGASGIVAAITASMVLPPAGDHTVTIDLKKNGTTVLSSTIVLDNTNTAYVAEAGTISVTTYTTGDLFEVFVTVGGSTSVQGQGLIVVVKFQEDVS